MGSPFDQSITQNLAAKQAIGKAVAGLCSPGEGVMQADPVLVAAERRLIDRAEEVILLVDSSKFRTQSGTIVCGLDEIDTIISDDGLASDMAKALRVAEVNLMICQS